MNDKKGQAKVAKQFQEDILSGMWEWRMMHPKATFVEIETEMEKRISRLRGRMMEELIEMSAAADLDSRETMRCPECGAAMERRGTHKRKMQATGGTEIEIAREYAQCPACGAGFFPSG